MINPILQAKGQIAQIVDRAAAAAIAAQSEETVNPALCEEALRQKMMEVQA